MDSSIVSQALKKILLKTILPLFVFASQLLHAQRQKGLSSEPEQWLQDLAVLLREENREKANLLITEFSSYWAGSLSKDQVALIQKTGNLFVRKRMMDLQLWDNYFRLIMHMNDQESPTLFRALLEDIDAYAIKNPPKITQPYIQNMYTTLFNKVMYDDGTLRWFYEGNFEMGYEEEPFFKLSNIELYATFKSDSTYIENTSGIYYPKRTTFVGQGGIMYWDRAGFSPDSAMAQLSSFSINVSKANFEADSVLFSSVVYLKEKVYGKLEERLSGREQEASANFPRFFSYRKDITIANVAENAELYGGYALLGSRFFATGTPDSNAVFKFYYEDKLVIAARSERFQLKPDIFTSESVAMSIYLEEDSIYHPKLFFRFVGNERLVSFVREDKGLGMSSLTNTYHNLDFKVQNIFWKMTEPKIYLSNANQGGGTPATFESNQYYRLIRMDALLGTSYKNPLFELQEMTRYYGSDLLTTEQVGSYLKMGESNARIYLMNLSVEGFVRYDLNTHTGFVLPKTYEYILNYKDKRDFDVIRFVSKVDEKTNAMLSLLNYDMTIEGVQAIAVSDSQQVGFFPVDQKVIMHRGLNFDFDGRIIAGRFSFWGRTFKFKYESFMLDMPVIDSMRFKVESFEQNPFGERELKDVQNVLADLTGQLDIDKPNNKSGRVSYPEYPIFKSLRESYVYYNRPSIFGGVYPKESFYVQLEPFEIDSLDNATTEGIFFDGTFVSAGIFPDMEQTIKVQRDYSLGFETTTPPDGLSAYGGKGTFTSKLSLSNKGLRGDGEIDYLSANAKSQEFFFFPDSTNGRAYTYEIASAIGKGESPHVSGKEIDIHWEPKKDVMYASNTTTDFDMYDDVGMKTTGRLALGPGGLRGNTTSRFYNAELSSKDFAYLNKGLKADSTSFKVRPNDSGPWVFTIDNAKGDVGFTLNTGDFTLNNPADYMKFPEHEYLAYMDFAKWDIMEKSIEVKKIGAMPSSRMVSVNREQDSLQYVVGSVKFKMLDNYLEVFKANEIEVADATIYPDTGYVVIDLKAQMRLLTDARIEADRSNKFHKFDHVSCQIKGRKMYTASGDYEYLDEEKTPWPLYFEQITVNRDQKTIGRAQVKEEDNFFMSSYFGFYGRVDLLAPNKHLTFNGYTLIQQSCDKIQTNWFPFKSVINPENIVIDLPETAEELSKARLFNGIYISNDSTSGYSAFLSNESSRANLELILAGGKLYYDKNLFSYIITTADRIENPDAKGNYLALNVRDCITQGDGRLGFGDKTGQVSIDGFGSIEHKLESDEINIDMVLAFDFHFNDDVLKALTDKLQSSRDLEASKMDRPAYKVAINQILEKKEKAKFLEDLRQLGVPSKLPKEFQYTLSFNDLQMVWNPEINAFLSVGDIGIGSIGKYQINKKVTGVIEIARKRRGDEITIYLDLGGKDVFFFQYRRNVMEFYSPNQELMSLIMETKPQARRKEEKGKPPYTYGVSTRGKMNRFVNRMDDLE